MREGFLEYRGWEGKGKGKKKGEGTMRTQMLNSVGDIGLVRKEFMVLIGRRRTNLQPYESILTKIG